MSWTRHQPATPGPSRAWPSGNGRSCTPVRVGNHERRICGSRAPRPCSARSLAWRPSPRADPPSGQPLAPTSCCHPNRCPREIRSKSVPCARPLLGPIRNAGSRVPPRPTPVRAEEQRVLCGRTCGGTGDSGETLGADTEDKPGRAAILTFLWRKVTEASRCPGPPREAPGPSWACLPHAAWAHLHGGPRGRHPQLPAWRHRVGSERPVRGHRLGARGLGKALPFKVMLATFRARWVLRGRVWGALSRGIARGTLGLGPARGSAPALSPEPAEQARKGGGAITQGARPLRNPVIFSRFHQRCVRLLGPLIPACVSGPRSAGARAIRALEWVTLARAAVCSRVLKGALAASGTA